MNQQMIECKKMIADWHKWGKITSVKLDGVEHSRATEDEIMNAKTLTISKKHLDLFVDSSLVDVVHQNFVEHARDILVVNSKGKIKDYSISTHAKRQFMRRYYIVNLDSLMSVHLSENIKKSFEMLQGEIADILFKQDWDNPLIVDLIVSFLKTATTRQTISSARDQRELARRGNRYANSTYSFSHPFMFVIVDGTIATIELSSQSLDCRNSNKIATSNDRWEKFFQLSVGAKEPS